KMNVRYICFAADSFVVDTSKIGGADIETYYRSHPEEFTGPPEVTLVVTMVPRRPKEPDFAVARERMMGIREQIAALPDSFPRYARTHSEAGTRAGLPTSQTPFFREGNSKNDVFKRFPEAERWAFKAKVGSVSSPIPTENGWYLYEIADRQPAGLRPLTQARVFARERLIYSLQLARASEAAN